MDDVYKAAKAEGQVVFGGAIKEENEQRLMAVFEKRFPGIAVKYTRRSTEPMVQLVEAERRANRVSFDLLNLTEPGDVVRWIKQGFLASVPIPDTDKMLPETFDPNGFYAALSVTPMLGIASTKVLKPGEMPTSLKALVTDPKWKGKVVISRPIRGGTSSGALMNVVNAVGRDFIKSAKDRDILLTLGNEAAIASVVSGERPVSWGASGYRAIEAKSEGSPIELIVWEEGVALAQFIGVVPAKAPHPNAARLLLRWLMTPEGQELLVKNVNQYSARKDVAVTPLNQPPLSSLKINAFSNEKIVNEGHALAVEFDKAVGM
jgi:iron(III) transport system substrate-binding protein